MKLRMLPAFVILSVATTIAAAAPSVTLVKDGQPACAIVIAKDARTSARFGACELQWHIKKMTGAEIPIVSATENVQGIRIYVGESDALKQAAGFSTEGFQTQEYVVSVQPDRIILAGRDADVKVQCVYNMEDPIHQSGFPDWWTSNGSLYAVYDFLERSCGVRWFNQTESGTFIPEAKTLSVPCGELRRRPAFIFRTACAGAGNPPAYDAYVSLWKANDPQYKEWDALAYAGLHKKYPIPVHFEAARGIMDYLFLLRSREGGDRMICNHSFYGFYDRFWEKNPNNPAVFVEKRPNYFAKGYGANAKPPQLCYTDPGLIEQIAQDAADYYDGKKTAAQLNMPYWLIQPNPFPVEPMDNGAFCKCENCAKFFAKPKAPELVFSTGGDSDYFFNFVNEVCKELHKTHPDRGISCLAYFTHARVPSFKLDPGVNVQYCFVSNRGPYNPVEYNNDLANLAAWAAEKKVSGRRLGLWLYYTFPVENANDGNYHCFPGFFAHTIGKQMKLFHEYGIYGMFHCGYGQEVEAYVTFRLMNDPSLDVDELLDEYFKCLYGNAAEPMKKFYAKVEETYCNPASYIAKVKVFDILDHMAAGRVPFKISQLKAIGIGVTQDTLNVGDKGKDRLSRFANVRVCEIAPDGSDGKELLKDDFKGPFKTEWLSDSNFVQGKDGERNVIELPWNVGKAVAIRNLQSAAAGNGVRITWEHLADGFDFYRQWHVILATRASLDSLDGYDVTYERNGWTNQPFMDILKIADAIPGKNTGSIFKLYGNEKPSADGRWTPCPTQGAKPSSLLMDQAFSNGAWTRFQLDVTQEAEGTRLRLYMQRADPDSKQALQLSGQVVSWAILGTEERMAELASLMESAEKLAQTDMEKDRVALFKKAVWEYMTTGAGQYRKMTQAPIPSLAVPAIQDAKGDFKSADWSKTAALGETWFKTGTDERSDQKLSGRICHDEKFLYLELSDACDTGKLVTSAGVAPYDDWEIFAAGQRASPYRQFLVSPGGEVVAFSNGEVNWRMNVPIADAGVRAISDVSAKDRWVTHLAIPLAGLTAQGMAADGKFYLNVARVTSPQLTGTGQLGIATWVPYTRVHEVERLAEITLAP